MVKRVRRAVDGGHWVRGRQPVRHRRQPGVRRRRRRRPGRRPAVAAARAARRSAADLADPRITLAVSMGGNGPSTSTPPTASPTTRRSRCTRAASSRSTPTRLDRLDRRPRPRPTRPASPGCPAPSPPSPSWPAGSPGRRASSRSSPTARPCWAWATSGRPPSLPVMEGKACLFSEFGGLSAVPIVLSTNDVDAIVETVVAIAPSFGGINLEDISAPALLRDRGAAARAARHPGHARRPARDGDRRPGRAAQRGEGGRPADLGDLRVVVAGAGAAGVACTKILLEAGIGDIAVADSKGILHAGRDDLTPIKQWLVDNTNTAGYAGHDGRRARAAPTSTWGSPAARCPSRPSRRWRRTASSSRWPTRSPRSTRTWPRSTPPSSPPGAATCANQINNVLAFPGIFRGAIDAGAHRDHRGDEAGRGRRRSPTSSATTCGRTTSCPARWTAGWPRPSPTAVAACAREQGVTG